MSHVYAVLYLTTHSCPTLCDPMDCSPPGSSVHGDSPSKNTGVGCHAFFQGIFPMAESTNTFISQPWMIQQLKSEYEKYKGHDFPVSAAVLEVTVP